MKRFLTISSFIFLQIKISAQDTCLPKYGLPIETIKLSYGNIAYVEKGKGETILFIHGLGGNISHWTKTINGLSAFYRCIAIDLPGYGWSDKKPAANTDQLKLYADALKEFLEKMNIKKVIVAGHSMGGQVATIMALQNKKIKKLILVAPAGLETFSESEAKILIASTPASAFEKQDEVVIRNNFKINFYNQPVDVEQLIQDRLAFKKCAGFKSYCETVSNGVKGMLAHPVRDSLKYLSMPVLIVFGANDALIPNRYLHAAMQTSELARQSAGLIKNCRVEMIAEAGHMVQYEKPDELNSIVKTFIK
jgi:pimeloyl-ACP methyl ester carboxylesterase